MNTETKSCSKCGKTIILTPNGWVHQGGGMYEQKCRGCGWSGGQAGSYQACPRCGNQTDLVDDHVAS